MRLSSPASPGSDLAASSFLMASGSGEGQCKARGLRRRLDTGVVLAETRNGGSTCSGTPSHPQPPQTSPPQAPTARLPAMDTEKPEPSARGGGLVVPAGAPVVRAPPPPSSVRTAGLSS